MPDPFLTAAQRTFALAFEEMNACLDGLSVEQLNWRPEGPDLNSVAALAVHSLNSARSCWPSPWGRSCRSATAKPSSEQWRQARKT